MQKIDAESFEKLASKPRKLMREKSVERKMVDALNIGEGAVIFKNEWRLKSSPITVACSSKGRKFSSKTLADGSGWAILRLS